MLKRTKSHDWPIYRKLREIWRKEWYVVGICCAHAKTLKELDKTNIETNPKHTVRGIWRRHDRFCHF